jgi:hypothetical protein
MRIILLAIAVAGLVPRAADACSCMPPRQPCQAVWKARYVFSGAVTAIRTEQGQRVVTFRVERTWRHDIPGRSLPETVTVSTARDDGACGYPFARGGTYLVYADGEALTSMGLRTSICTRTRPIEEAAEDLAYFAEMESGARTSRIFGQIRPLPDAASSPPIGGLRIELRTANSLRTTTTDSSGRFEFRSLPVQMYEVAARVPETYVPTRAREPIWLAHPTACAEVDLLASWDGQVTGTIVDSSGTPLRNIEIEARARGARFGVSLTSDDDGRFTFAGLAPGTYTIGINLSGYLGEPGSPVILRDDVSVGPGKRVAIGVLEVR